MLPVYLNPGYVSIYGSGSLNSIFSPNKNTEIFFGIIEQTSNSPLGVNTGDSVMYNVNDAIELIYGDNIFYILPQTKILLIEIPPVS